MVKKIVIAILFAVFLFIFIYDLVNIGNWSIDNKKIDDQVKEIQDIVKVNEVPVAPQIENINVETKLVNNEEKTGLYWEYTKIKLIDVDIKELKKKNKDTVGWIQVGGTNINYPFVQAKDNIYYLNHSFNKSKNNAGWIFLDYRNNMNKLDKNTIIYGHSRLNKTMFGTLNKVAKNDWFKNKGNHIIKISSEKENSLWQVFSVYRIKTTDDYLRTSFAGNKDYENFIKLIKDRSIYNFKVDMTTDDYILTLSTCADNDKKTVVHAKLLKKG